MTSLLSNTHGSHFWGKLGNSYYYLNQRTEPITSSLYYKHNLSRTYCNSNYSHPIYLSRLAPVLEIGAYRGHGAVPSPVDLATQGRGHMTSLLSNTHGSHFWGKLGNSYYYLNQRTEPITSSLYYKHNLSRTYCNSNYSHPIYLSRLAPVLNIGAYRGHGAVPSPVDLATQGKGPYDLIHTVHIFEGSWEFILLPEPRTPNQLRHHSIINTT